MLDDKGRMALDFERQWWKYAGAKERAIRELFGETATRYYQRLNALLDEPEAMAYDAVTVGRLRRLREERRGVRSARMVRCPQAAPWGPRAESDETTFPLVAGAGFEPA